jgi:hypothetical protein
LLKGLEEDWGGFGAFEINLESFGGFVKGLED